MDTFEIFINPENFIDETNIEEFETEMKTSTFLKDKLEKMNEILINLGFKYIKLEFIEEDEEDKHSNKKQKKPAKKIGKDAKKSQSQKKKAEIFDEEELMKFKMRELKEKMIVFYNKVTPFFRIQVLNENGKKIFFEKCYNLLFELSSDRELRGNFIDILFNLLESQKICKRFSYVIIEIIVKMIDKDIPSDKENERIIKFLEFLSIDVTANNDINFVNLFKKILFYIITKKEFDSDIKAKSIHCLNKLIKFDNFSQFRNELFMKIIEYINFLSHFEESGKILNFLVLHLEQPEKKFEFMFEDILNINETAQQIILDSLLSSEEIKIIFTFEIIAKLKIISYECSPAIQQSALKIYQKSAKINEQEVQNFEMYKFVTSNTKENIDIFCKISYGN